jgi:hypothetical protein
VGLLLWRGFVEHRQCCGPIEPAPLFCLATSGLVSDNIIKNNEIGLNALDLMEILDAIGVERYRIALL